MVQRSLAGRSSSNIEVEIELGNVEVEVEVVDGGAATVSLMTNKALQTVSRTRGAPSPKGHTTHVLMKSCIRW
jgi:hypothetical protein